MSWDGNILVLCLAAGWSALVAASDLKRRIIPNYLSLGAMLLVLATRLAMGGWAALLEGIAAGMVAGTFLLLPFLMRGAGGGDVKMLCAAGTIVGWSRVLYLLWFMSLAGLLLAVGMLVCKRADGGRLQHYARCLVDWRYDRKAGAASLPPKESHRERVPFAIAISIGLVLAMMIKP